MTSHFQERADTVSDYILSRTSPGLPRRPRGANLAPSRAVGSDAPSSRVARSATARNGTARGGRVQVKLLGLPDRSAIEPITALMPDVAATKGVRPLATAWTLVIATLLRLAPFP